MPTFLFPSCPSWTLDFSFYFSVPRSLIPRCAQIICGFKTENATKEYFYFEPLPFSPPFSCAGEWLRNRERPLQCDPVPCCSLLSGDGQGPGWTHERMWQVHGATKDHDTPFSLHRESIPYFKNVRGHLFVFWMCLCVFVCTLQLCNVRGEPGWYGQWNPKSCLSSTGHHPAPPDSRLRLHCRQSEACHCTLRLCWLVCVCVCVREHRQRI